jgi:hypothetical protein
VPHVALLDLLELLGQLLLLLADQVGVHQGALLVQVLLRLLEVLLLLVELLLLGVEDLLELQRMWNFESDWYWPSPLLDPAFFRQRAKRLNWPREKLAVYQRHFERLGEIADYHGSSPVQAEREMARLSREIITSWGKDRPVSLLSAPGR